MPRKERMRVFEEFRKEGMYCENKRRIKSGKGGNLHRERRQGDSSLILCNICSGFFAKRYFYRHKERCQSKTDATNVTVNAIPADLLLESEESKDFTANILSKFIHDDVGKLIPLLK